MEAVWKLYSVSVLLFLPPTFFFASLSAERCEEVLPVAEAPGARVLSTEEQRRLAEQEENTLRELRLFLRDVTKRLATDKRFNIFSKPVDIEEVKRNGLVLGPTPWYLTHSLTKPVFKTNFVFVCQVSDYLEVIRQPMDLSTVMTKIDTHQYLTVKEFLVDIDLICSNALEYNPDKDPGGEEKNDMDIPINTPMHIHVG